jgi:periplasmic protein TonB
MLAYAANRPVPGKRQSSPNALLIVISVHVALLALVMSAKMDLPQRIKNQPTIVEFFPRPAPPQPVRPSPAPRPQNSVRLANPQRDVPLPPTADQPMDTGPTTIDSVPVGGGGAAVIPIIPKPLVTPVHHDPRLLTPPTELKPPYPLSKLLSEEEATLRLRLTIDENGRVAAVDPVGRADPVFLDAARRHLMAHWRYQPASENGRAIASAMVITLKFQLDG